LRRLIILFRQKTHPIMKKQMRKARTRDRTRMRVGRFSFGVGVGFHPRGKEFRMSSAGVGLGSSLRSSLDEATCVEHGQDLENEGVWYEDLGFDNLRLHRMLNHKVCMIQPVSKDHRRFQQI
jgi:hypothetical protein